MIIKIYRVLLKKFVKYSPIITSFFFCLFDSIPLYIFNLNSFKTQVGLTVIYAWICCDYKRMRPFLILICGLLIDIFSNWIFGFSSILLLLVHLLQRGDREILSSSSFNITWGKFIFFILIYNLLNTVFFNLFEYKVMVSMIDIAYSILVTMLIFPLIFSVINNLNERIKINYE